MTVWTFTTSDPAEAHKLSLFCLTEGLHYTAEARDTATPVAKRTPAKRKTVALGGWADPEARKVRAKVQAWANANVRKKGEPFSYRAGRQDLEAYAEALGISKEKAQERISLHHEYLSLFQRSGGLFAR